MEELAIKFKDEQFLMKRAYVSDIFGKLNDVNLRLQEKISSFN